MILAAVNVLPVPGGPCTARYDESRSSSAAVMSVVTSPVCGSAAPLRVRGERRSRMSTTGLQGRSGSAAATSAAAASMASRCFFVPTSERGVSANGSCVNVAVLGLALTDEHLGRKIGVIDLGDLGIARGAPVGVVGHPRR